jgi:RNA polymerase sigma-70 factor (ECF subfamily)
MTIMDSNYTFGKALVIDATHVTDSVLVRAAQNGNHRGFDLLVKRHQDRLFRSVFAVVRSAAVAEDITQDAFVRAFVNIASFRGNSQFYSWLFRIALNCRRKYLGRRIQNVPLEAAVSNNITSERAIDQPDLRLIQSERVQAVRLALGRIEPRHREILILREYEGMNYQAIADLLGVPLGTIRSRISRARKRLRRELLQVNALLVS